MFNSYSVSRFDNYILFLLTCTLLFVSCTGIKEFGRSYHINEEKNEYDGSEIVEQRYNTNQTLGTNVDGLSVRRKSTSKNTSLFLVVYKNSSDPSYFENDPLRIKVDGREEKFEYVDSNTNVIAATNIQMWGYYASDRSSIRAIAQANDLRASISTVDGRYTVVYDKRVIDRIDQFVADGYKKK